MKPENHAEVTTMKACQVGCDVKKKKRYSPVYLHALMGAEEWEAAGKRETESRG